MVIIVARIGMLIINKSCNLYVFCCFLSEKTGTFSANFNIYFMLKMLEMAFPGFKFQKFSGGEAPGSPYRAWPPATPVLQCYGQFTTLDPPL